MKFAVVGPAPPFRGGIAEHTATLVRALRASDEDDGARHTVTVHPYRRLYPRLLFPGTSQLAPDGGAPLPGAGAALDPYDPRTWRRVADEIAVAAPDLAVVQWWHPWFAPMLAWLLGALPARGFARERLAVVCHNVLPHQPVPLQRTLARSVLRRAGHVVVHARSEAERVLALVPRARVHCVPMPCLAPEAPAPSREAARARLGLDARPWVLCFGLVRAYKGLDDLLVATAATPDDAFRVLIAGEFYVREAPLRARARALGIEDRVRIENRFFADREVPDLFAAADLVVLPYRRATQSAVLPLAVRYRRKLVVTDAGGLAEAAPEVARVVPAASPGALAAALVEALAAPAPDEGAFAAAEARQHPAGLRRAFAAIAAESRGSTAEPSPVLASVVVCTQGTEPLLRDCLVALCDQELPDGVRHEVVVVAGTEPAAIRAMLGEGFDCAGVDVRIVHEPERGLNHKRNRGVREARGTLLLFTDDDCVPDRGWVAACCAALRSHAALCGRVVPLNRGYRASVRTATAARLHRGRAARAAAWRIGCGNNMAFRRATLDDLGGFCPAIGVGTWSGAACDTELFLRALRRGVAIAYVPDAVVLHRQPRFRADWLRKRRAYYRGVSYLARRVHPTDWAAWWMAATRLLASAAELVLGTLLLRRTAVTRALVQCRGCLEGLLPPAGDPGSGRVTTR